MPKSGFGAQIDNVSKKIVIQMDQVLLDKSLLDHTRSPGYALTERYQGPQSQRGYPWMNQHSLFD